MLIGTNLLLVPFYRPLDVAEVATTMDILTGGRFALGIGLGYREFEFDNLGVPRSERAGRLTETVEILRRLWAGEAVTHAGKYYRLNDVRLTMRPVREPHPPILIGANVPAAVRRAGEIGDGWIASGNVSIEALLALRAEYERGRLDAGRPEPAERFLFLDVYLSDDRRRAVQEIAPYVKAAYDAFVSWGNVKVERLDVPPEVLAERFVVGDPAYCIARLREYHERGGFNHVLARVQLPGPGGSLSQERVLRTIRLLGTEVAPALRSLA
jgi:alkanesulfonate monooxygenase SsuD/methylene tetrahydromethanopterin reductase-like flavin-dependent oxidoreductase (luciferase family)